MLITTIKTSAHDLTGVEDRTIHAIPTSPPFFGLRSYAGEQDVLWPTVVFRLNEWCEPLTIQGCLPDCTHEWGDEMPPHHPGQVEQTKWKNAKAAGHGQTASSGRYCVHCGGWRGPLGLEPSPVAYIGHLILCLREWRRVLRDDGVCFVNLGDSYNNRAVARPSSHQTGLGFTSEHLETSWRDLTKQGLTRGSHESGLKEKDLIGIPWMFALAARADGWYLRSDIIWSKPNPMPESVTDRPTKAHEYVFLLAKSPRYYWDADAVRKEKAASTLADQRTNNNGHRRERGFTGAPSNGGTNLGSDGRRNIRTVWTIATRPYAKAHYAVWPETLVEPMILASTSERGCCPDCGAPWRRVVEKSGSDWPKRKAAGEPTRHGLGGAQSVGATCFSGNQSTTTGWLPTCDHYGIEIPDGLFDTLEMPDDAIEPADCEECDGEGHLPGPPMFPTMTVTCPACNGTPIIEGNDAWHDWQAALEEQSAAQIALLASVDQNSKTVPAVVLDPFAGSGTTGRVAVKHRRRAILCDISNKYLAEHVPDRTTVQMQLV